MSNRSKPYGYYGGVSKENHYVPPPSTPFTPQPASIPFYDEYFSTSASILSTLSEVSATLIDNEGTIMRRYLVDRTDTQDFYEITTLDNPNDIITYATALTSDEDLTLMDGGEF